jgi:MFS family permease
VDPRLFRSIRFTVANILTALGNATMFMIWLLVPYYLLNTRDHSTIAGGLLLAANPIATAVAAPVAGRLSGAWGAGRVVAVGLAVQTAGLLAVAGLGRSTSVLLVAAALALVGAGVGLFTVPNMSLVMGSIGRAEQGVAGGLAQMMRTAGVVGGVAVGSLALTALRDREADRLHVPATDAATFLPAYRSVFLGAAAVAACAALLAVSRNADREPD